MPVASEVMLTISCLFRILGLVYHVRALQSRSEDDLSVVKSHAIQAVKYYLAAGNGYPEDEEKRIGAHIASVNAITSADHGT